jgi:hypothetical protein
VAGAARKALPAAAAPAALPPAAPDRSSDWAAAPPLHLADGGAPLLLLSAASGEDAPIAALYHSMVELVGPDAPAGPRKAFLDELNVGRGCDEPVDFFHVAIDAPGFGASKASLQARRRPGEPMLTATFLADVIRSLGKHYAFAIVAAADAVAAVVDALTEAPNMCSFLCVREPKVRDAESLHSIFQPVLLTVESRGQQAALAGKMRAALLHASVTEFSRIRQPKYLDREFGRDILEFMRARRWRGHLNGHGHSKKQALLTKLVGGMKMWRGERVWAGEPKAEMEASPSVAEQVQKDVASLTLAGDGQAPQVQFIDLQ